MKREKTGHERKLANFNVLQFLVMTNSSLLLRAAEICRQRWMFFPRIFPIHLTETIEIMSCTLARITMGLRKRRKGW